MRKLLSEVMVILLLLGACQKEPEWQESVTPPTSGDTVSKDLIHDAFAGALAQAISSRQVRQFLYTALARQFTGDYDIIYDLIRENQIVTEEYGTLSFSALLSKKAGEAGIDASVFGNLTETYKNLQISSPVFFENWDPDTYTPKVISLPVDYQENSGKQVRAFCAGGSEILVTESELKEPFLLVRLAERVDDNGMMRVDRDGFVIPEEERVFTAKEIYELPENELKSGTLVYEESVIEVLDENSFRKALLSRRITDKQAPAPLNFPEGKSIHPDLKSGSSLLVATPGDFRVNPAGPYTVQISWSQVPGATGYEIYRQYEEYPNYLLATVGADQINYYDQYLWVGEHYTYSVRSVDASGNVSPLTGGLETYASWRTNGNRDVVDKIYISSECWNWCCGLFDGKIELQYKISYLLTTSHTSVAYPASGLNNLGQKSKDQQKGKWCYYSHYLFPWDVRQNAYSYHIRFVEDDGSGDGKTIKFSTTFKIQIFKIVDCSITPAVEFKVADKDEEFGEVIICYWEYRNGPGPYTDGYDMMPDKGSARMYLRQ